VGEAKSERETQLQVWTLNLCFCAEFSPAASVVDKEDTVGFIYGIASPLPLNAHLCFGIMEGRLKLENTNSFIKHLYTHGQVTEAHEC
jgi:hypothetical protein